jgi:hypothetical protein
MPGEKKGRVGVNRRGEALATAQNAAVKKQRIAIESEQPNSRH